jgi:hypothetical protein
VIVGITLCVLVVLVIIEFLGRPPSPAALETVASETAEPETPAPAEVSGPTPVPAGAVAGSQAQDTSEADVRS